MGFAQEIRDFVAAYDAVAGRLQGDEALDIRRMEADSQRNYRDWLMGAQGREEDALVGYAETGNPLAPFDVDRAPPTGGAGRMSMSSGGLTGDEVANLTSYITTAANARGIDPNIALRVARAEGLKEGVWQSNLSGSYTEGGREASYGPYQLYMGGGLGNVFMKAGHGDPRDKSTVYKQIDFALDEAARGGWTPFHGAADNGIGRWAGLKGARPIGVSGQVAELAANVEPVSSTGNATVDAMLEDSFGNTDADYLQWQKDRAIPQGDAANDYLGPEGDAANDYLVAEGKDVDALTGPGDASEYDVTGKDDLLTDAGITLAGSEVPEIVTPELKGVEPVSLEPAVPEEINAMGFDPLPQRSGHTDRVSAAGYDGEVFASIDAPLDRSMLPRILYFGRKVFGAGGGGAIDTGDGDAGATAMDAGVGHADITLVERIENAIEKRFPGISQDQKTLRVLSTIWNWNIRKGKDPVGAAFGIYQLYKKMFNDLTELAKLDIGDGNFTEGFEKFAEAYSLIPDGEVMTINQNPNGTYNVVTTTEDGQTEVQVDLDAKEIVSGIMGITPDQFDKLVEAKFIKPEDAPSTLSGSLELYRERSGAIPERPGADAIPAPEDEGAIPAGSLEGEEGIQVASADPNAPVPTTATPQPRSVTIRPKPDAVPPPMSRQEFEDLIVNIPKEDAAIITEIWKQDWERYNDYIETLPTLQDIAAQEAYNKFFANYVKEPPDEFIAPTKYGAFIGGVDVTSESGKRAADTMRAMIDAHNARVTQIKEAEAGYISADVRDRMIGAIPKEVERYEPDQPLPDPGWDSTAKPTDVTGGTPIEARILTRPLNEAAALSQEHYAAVGTAYDNYNTRAKEWNEKLGSRAPLLTPDQQMEAKVAIDAAYDTYVGSDMEPGEFTAGFENAEPEVREAAEYITRYGGGAAGLVKDTAMAMMNIPENRNMGMSPETALQNAHDVLLFVASGKMYDESLFKATRVKPSENMPAGIVKVENLINPKEPPFYMPETSFVALDAVRQGLANQWFDEKWQGTLDRAARSYEGFTDAMARGERAIKDQQRMNEIDQFLPSQWLSDTAKEVQRREVERAQSTNPLYYHGAGEFNPIPLLEE